MEAQATAWDPRGRGLRVGLSAGTLSCDQTEKGLRKDSGHISRGQARTWKLERWWGWERH